MRHPGRHPCLPFCNINDLAWPLLFRTQHLSLEEVNTQHVDSGTWTGIPSGLWVNGNTFCCDSDLSPILPSSIPEAWWALCPRTESHLCSAP